MHRLAWHDPNRDEVVIRESLVLALLDAGETVMLQDEAENYIFIANLPAIWDSPSKSNSQPRDHEIFGDAIAAVLKKARDELSLTGNRVTVEVLAGDERTFQFQLFSTNIDDQRKLTKITIRDVSVERRRENLLRTLLREVSHRSRNLMAIIQSLSDQTSRYSATKEEFLRKFRGRLYALAQSQDLLTDSDWRGASLFQLLNQQFDLYLPEYRHLVKLAGDDIFLNPNGAMYIGLAFHELVVNTVSHGRKLQRGQEICVTCQLDGQKVIVTWYEPLRAGSVAALSEDKPKQSFGSVVLEKVVPVALNGTASYEISEQEISYRLEFSSASLA